VGLKEFFIKKPKILNPKLGVVVGERGLGVALRSNNSAQIECAYFENADTKLLKDWVYEHDLENCGFQLCLEEQQYKLYQIETPAVPEAELHNALLFNLNDRLDYPVNEAQLDYFDMPVDTQREGRNKVNVVVSHLPLLKKLIETLSRSAIQPAVINIPEMAVKNLLQSRESMQKGVCFVSYQETFIKLMIYRNDMLYLTRKVNIPSWDACLSHPGDSSSENLVLEIQRTLDYYQSQLGQPPVTEIVIPDWTDSLQELVTYLHKNIGISVSILENKGFDKSRFGVMACRQMSMASAAFVEENLNAAS